MTATQLEIEKQYAEAAVNCSREIGMKAGFDLLTVAQAILESGWNPHYSGTWNPLGIKADNFNALGSTETETHETVNGVSETVELPFQDYASLEDCFADHARIFLTGPLAPKYKAWAASGAPLDALCVAISFPSPRPLYATAENYLSSLRSMLAMQSLVAAVMAARAALKSSG
jgi:flagellum-specific peptidoglycan hydrolase FlgJ